ncbi:hypothetical protein F4780DRAFT_438551 [Xylariomycetidae sp. FL0641]|nr:hypothetical protein F4780DRAFT_438551 [Xylariomycetidae sp. FL0641]
MLSTTSITYDHRIWSTRGPVRSPIDKPDTAGSVVGSVTTSESPVFFLTDLRALQGTCALQTLEPCAVDSVHASWLVAVVMDNLAAG